MPKTDTIIRLRMGKKVPIAEVKIDHGECIFVREMRESSEFFPVSDLLVAWQRTREAIGRVETSQPAQMTEAIGELVAARDEMERTIRALMNDIFRSSTNYAET